MKKLEKLTDAQLALLPKQIEKWLQIGLSTEPLDFDKAKDCVIAAYKPAVYFQLSYRFYRDAK